MGHLDTLEHTSAHAVAEAPVNLLLESAGISHVGMVRAHNEDALIVQAETGSFVLSDGMGGYNAGEVASAITVEVVSKALAVYKENLAFNPDPDPVVVLADAIERANRTIIETGALRPECLGMGCTVVAVTLLGEQLWFAHVGDSRLYRMRGGVLQQLTRDHSVGQEMRDAGVLSQEQARNYQGRGILTRALGVEPDVRPDVGCSDLQADDVFIICSDGLSDMVSDQGIQDIITHRRNTSCHTIALALQAEALAAGGMDNISALILRCVAQPY
jgi:PPM family protein phosphatase